MLRGTRRPANSSLNTPVVVHSVGKPAYLSKDETLQFLAKFIREKESVITTSAVTADATTSQGVVTSGGISAEELALDTQLSGALAQLKRVEREFKGLPPQVMEMDSSANATQKQPEVDTVAMSATGGKKIKFADEPEPQTSKQDSKDSSQDSPSSTDDSSEEDSD